MRIGFYCRHLEPHKSGVVMFFHQLAGWLQQRGHDVRMFTDGPGEAPAGVRVHQLAGLDGPGSALAAQREALDVYMCDPGCRCRGGRFNVLIPGYGTPNLRNRDLASFRSPLVRRLRALWRRFSPRERENRRRTESRLRQVDPAPHVVAQSKMIREDIRSEFGIPDDRLHLVYQSVDTDHFSPARCAEVREAARRELGLSADTVCFLFVGHAFRRKGLRELLEATGRLRRRTSGFRLVVAGRGPRLAYSIRARLAGCGGLADFVGGVRDVVRLFAAADAFVFPTWYDAFGRVVLEAMACGLPVVVTRANNGSAEVVTHGREGFLVDTPADRDALTERMVELMDPQLRARMGAAARATAERFDQPAFLNSILRVFEAAAATAPLPAAQGVPAVV